MATLTEKQIRDAVKEILKSADLSSLSSKKVRKSLEEKFCVDLTERKQQIDDILMELINAEENADEKQDGKMNDEKSNGEGEQSDSDETASGTKNNSSNGFSASSTGTTRKRTSSSECSGSDDEELKKPNKKQKTVSVKNNAKPKSSDKINDSSDDEVDDEALARKLHEEGLGVRPRSSKKPEKKPRKSLKGEKSTRRKGTSSYSQACVLSEELASVMGTDRMARKDVVSHMWKIFKERNLMDPKNKKFVICDEQLQKVFKTKRFQAFGMMKILKNHIKDAKLVQS